MRSGWENNSQICWHHYDIERAYSQWKIYSYLGYHKIFQFIRNCLCFCKVYFEFFAHPVLTLFLKMLWNEDPADDWPTACIAHILHWIFDFRTYSSTFVSSFPWGIIRAMKYQGGFKACMSFCWCCQISCQILIEHPRSPCNKESL